MNVELIQKFLLACVPVYFYFIPELLFPFFYNKYVKSSFYKIHEQKLDAYEDIQELKRSISRILEFIAFLSVVVLTLIATFYNKLSHSFFYQDCYLSSFLVLFAGLSVLVLYTNSIKSFTLNIFERNIERFVLLLSMPLLYFWG